VPHDSPSPSPAAASTSPAATSPSTAATSSTRNKKTLLELGADQLSPIEKLQIKVIGKSFDPGRTDKTIRVLQRAIGSTWIEVCIRRVRHVIGGERIASVTDNTRDESFIIVANHRSFFDLYVVTGYLVFRGLTQRIVFPVRSKFFYDKPLGFVVNGVMSFFAMYPPIFRERERAPLNVAALDEVVRLLKRGGTVVGLHPEGQRNKTDDPYALLPAQSGVGRIVHDARVPVVPVFINGLHNDLPRQLAGNLSGTSDPVVLAFGAPIDFGDMLDEPASPRLFKRISEKCMAEVAKLGEEEKAYRAGL
jgi:1-acyl-sn-glycerol-3-phosphate acyltransferase